MSMGDEMCPHWGGLKDKPTLAVHVPAPTAAKTVAWHRATSSAFPCAQEPYMALEQLVKVTQTTR